MVVEIRKANRRYGKRQRDSKVKSGRRVLDNGPDSVARVAGSRHVDRSKGGRAFGGYRVSADSLSKRMLVWVSRGL